MAERPGQGGVDSFCGIRVFGVGVVGNEDDIIILDALHERQHGIDHIVCRLNQISVGQVGR